MRTVNRLSQYWAARTVPGANAQRFFGYLVLILSLLATVLVTLSTSHPYVRQTTTIAALFWIALLLALRHGTAISRVCHWGTVIALMQVFLTAWFSGGVYASALAWMPVLVIATYFLLGRNVALIWVLINLLIYTILAFAPPWLGVAPPFEGVSSAQGVIALVDQSLVFISITLVMLFYYQFDRKAFTDLSERQTQLHAQSNELQQTLVARAHLSDCAQEELQNAIQSIAELNDIIAAELQGKPGALLVLEHTQRSTQMMLQILQSLPRHSTDLERSPG
jgi:hypothetical protein